LPPLDQINPKRAHDSNKFLSASTNNLDMNMDKSFGDLPIGDSCGAISLMEDFSVSTTLYQI